MATTRARDRDRRAIGSGLVGLRLSQGFSVAAGGAISLVAAAVFALSWLAAHAEH